MIDNIAGLVVYGFPPEVLQDIINNIVDWVLGGGSLEDDYIHQQFKFANDYVALLKNKF